MLPERGTPVEPETLMLGRTANDLFWMSRYIERAENIARLLEVGYRIALLPREGHGQDEEWQSTLRSAGCEKGYLAKYGAYDTRDVVNFMLFDADNPSSVYSCLATARRNARAQRTALTREMWESLNGAWLEFSAKDADGLAPNALPPLFDWIKERSALFRGALLNTILRNDTFYFSQLGTFLERADNTARILDVKYYVLLPHNEIVGGEIDSVQWAAILRSVSAHRSYRWVYKDSYKPWRIADYLILNRQMPRSLRSCYEEIVLALVELGHFYGAVNGPQSLAERNAAPTGRRRHERHLPVRPARVPRRLHRPQQPARAARSPPPTTSPTRRCHADQRPPRHALHLRRAGELHGAEPAADAGAVHGPARRNWHVRVPGCASRCGSRTASATPCTSSRSTPAPANW